jgi:hypothetical protein
VLKTQLAPQVCWQHAGRAREAASWGLHDGLRDFRHSGCCGGVGCVDWFPAEGKHILPAGSVKLQEDEVGVVAVASYV